VRAAALLPHPVVRALRRLRGAWNRGPARPLGDSSASDYSDKLDRFAVFASRELDALVATLPIRPASRVLDAGCGTGRLLPTLQHQAGHRGLVVGMDLSGAHIRRARRHSTRLLQGDFDRVPFQPQTFDAIWMLNALNHSADRRGAIEGLVRLLRPGGCLALAQSAMLPDLMFAWDLRLERLVNDACRRAYHDAYGLGDAESAGVRRLVGLLREAGLTNVTVTTTVVERVSPLGPEDERYLREVVFEGYWGEKLRPYLSRADWRTLTALCDPRSPQYAPARADFHHAQTVTLAVGTRSG
jgi:ubiquinone/menaquinone biosynthesis C-methylase UbiE